MQFLCPVCKAKVASSKKDPSFSPFFPFCSDRCRLMDLGQWLDGQYRIPVTPEEPDEDTPQSHEEQNE